MVSILIVASVGLASVLNAPIASPLGAELRPVNASQAQEKSSVAVAGLLVVSVTPDGLADDLGLKADDVIHRVNEARTTSLQDLTSAGITPHSRIIIEFARNGRVRVLERAAEAKTDLKVAFIGADSSEAATLLKNAGFAIQTSSGLPQSLDEFDIVVIENENAATPSNASRIEAYLRQGGGVVLTGRTPYFFAGSSVIRNYDTDLSSISPWFGAIYVNSLNSDEGSSIATTVQNTFDSSKIRNGDTVWKFGGSRNIVYIRGLGEFAMPRANTDYTSRTWQVSSVTAFTNEYVKGRLFWTYLPHDHQYPKLGELFVAGTEWVAKRD